MEQKDKEIVSAEEEVQQIKGQSWFDAEQKGRKKLGRKSQTRIVFTSLINSSLYENPTDATIIKIATEIFDFFTSFTTQNDEGDEIELLGGVVLVSEGKDMSKAHAALGFLEVDSPTVACEILRQLNQNDTTALESIRILLISDDCPCNDFGQFGVYLASPPTEDHVDIEKEGPTFVFSNIMKNLCNQCRLFYAEAEKYQNEENIRILTGAKRKSIPSALRVASCAKSNEFPTLQEYLEIYHSPIYFELDSEKMSPLLPVIDWKKVQTIASSL